MIPIYLSLEPVRTSLVGVQTFDGVAGLIASGDQGLRVKRLCPEGDVSLDEQNAGRELKRHKIHIKVSYSF
jgi:hypothetical protein